MLGQTSLHSWFGSIVSESYKYVQHSITRSLNIYLLNDLQNEFGFEKYCDFSPIILKTDCGYYLNETIGGKWKMTMLCF